VCGVSIYLIYIYIYVYIYIYIGGGRSERRDAGWPLHDIAITNIVLHVLQYRVVGGKHYIAQ